MSTSQNHKYTQLKWLYSALSGVCVAYFLALFSGAASVEESVFLQISTILFAICFPIYTTFAIAHIYMHERDVPVDICDKVLEEQWVTRLTIGSFVVLVCAFITLVGFFSISAMLGFISVAVCCFYRFVDFVQAIEKLS